MARLDRATAPAQRRFNPLSGEWVLVSPFRTERPWHGQVEVPDESQSPAYEPGCYLCPGNQRANGQRNPSYTSTFAFDNDFGALSSESATATDESRHELLIARPERGICRVLCLSPRHDLTLSRLEQREIRQVVDAWIAEYAAAACLPWARYAIAFENRGAMMGASNPHPHGQIWITESVPNEPLREQASFDRHRAAHGTCLLCDYLSAEIDARLRTVCANEHFAAIVPFWAAWPFETLVVSRRHVQSLEDLQDAEREGLADLLKRLTTRYDNLFEASCPYSMGVHQEPFGEARNRDWHLHLHFYPPLLRSASIRKFMVGFELLGSPQRDLTPEEAAARMQTAGEVHYRMRAGAGTQT